MNNHQDILKDTYEISKPLKSKRSKVDVQDQLVKSKSVQNEITYKQFVGTKFRFSEQKVSLNDNTILILPNKIVRSDIEH